MINFCTKRDKIQDNIIRFIDSEFSRIIHKTSQLTESDKDILKAIDKSTILMDNIISTPFGNTVLENISSGCKTLIVINHLDKKVTINANNCGDNAINYMLQNMSDKEISLYISYIPYIDRKYRYKGQVRINEEVIDINELESKIAQALREDDSR